MAEPAIPSSVDYPSLRQYLKPAGAPEVVFVHSQGSSDRCVLLARWPIIKAGAPPMARALGHRRHLPPGRLDSSETWRTDQTVFRQDGDELWADLQDDFS